MTDDPVAVALEGVDVDAPDGAADADVATSMPSPGEPSLEGSAEGSAEGSSEGSGPTDSEGFSPRAWAERVPEGSHLEFDAAEWWDPKNGAENRIAFHLADAAGAGAGYPNALGVLVGLAEVYWREVRRQQGSSSGSTSSTTSGEDGADSDSDDYDLTREEAEQYV